MTTYRQKVEKIAEGIFLHGKLTPDQSYGLPRGQLTVAQAVDQLVQLHEEEIEEIKQYIKDNDGGDGFSQTDQWIDYLESKKIKS